MLVAKLLLKSNARNEKNILKQKSMFKNNSHKFKPWTNLLRENPVGYQYPFSSRQKTTWIKKIATNFIWENY